jgi:hypothetical protein
VSVGSLTTTTKKAKTVKLEIINSNSFKGQVGIRNESLAEYVVQWWSMYLAWMRPWLLAPALLKKKKRENPPQSQF